MPIDKAKRILAGVVLAAPLVFVQATADPSAGQSSGKSDQEAKSPSVTATTDPGTTSDEDGDARANAEGGKTTSIKPFVPSETISADSAIAFPVDI